MATRNLTSKFESYRSSVRAGSKRTRGGDGTGNGESGRLLTGSSSDDLEVGSGAGSRGAGGLNHEMPPEWVDITDAIHKDLAKVKDSIRTLQKLHAARLKVSFGDDIIAEQERDIEILTQEITRVLRKSESNVKRIAVVGNAGTLNAQEKAVRLNVMRSLASDLQAQSKIFRTAQKDFLKNLRDQEQAGAAFGFNDDKDAKMLGDEDALDRGLTAEQQQALVEMNDRASEREKEIIRIAQSINELASLFRELNVLVLEQGTILDRIDYHVEQASVKVRAGVVELEKADEYSKKAYTLKCILLLLLICAGLLVGLIVSKTNK